MNPAKVPSATKAVSSKVSTFSDFSGIPKEELPIFEKTLKPEYSPATKKAIVFDLRHFIEWYGKKSGSFSLPKVTAQNLKEYQDYCKNELKHSPFTTKRKMNHLKTLYATAISSGKVKNSPVLIS